MDMDINFLKEESIKQVKKKLNHILCSNSVIALGIGGSICRNFGDEWSDIDVFLITNDFLEIKKLFQNTSFDTFKKTMIFRLPSQSFRIIEIRCLDIKDILAMKIEIDKSNDISPENLDLIYILKNGIYIKDKNFLEKIKLFEIKKETKKKFIKKNLYFVQDYGFKYFLKRNDFPQYYEMLNIIFRAYIHIISIYYDIGFIGYKHSINRRNIIPKDCLEIEYQFDFLFKNPNYDKIIELIKNINEKFKLDDDFDT
jgi:hypothetical protein